jgi:SnoaL-like polyketide cyclase
VAVYTDDVEHDVVGAPEGPLHGPAAARARYAALMANVRTEEMVLRRRFHGIGDRGSAACIVEHDVAARVVGEFAGIPGRGRTVRFRLLHVFEFAGGRISRENVWMDTATVLAQLTAPERGGSAPAPVVTTGTLVGQGPTGTVVG